MFPDSREFPNLSCALSRIRRGSSSMRAAKIRVAPNLRSRNPMDFKKTSRRLSTVRRMATFRRMAIVRRMAIGMGIGAGVSAGLVAAAGVAVLRKRQIDLTNQVVVITGGSRGLGLAVAEEFGKRRCRQALCARDEEELSRARLSWKPRAG